MVIASFHHAGTRFDDGLSTNLHHDPDYFDESLRDQGMRARASAARNLALYAMAPDSTPAKPKSNRRPRKVIGTKNVPLPASTLS